MEMTDPRTVGELDDLRAMREASPLYKNSIRRRQKDEQGNDKETEGREP